MKRILAVLLAVVLIVLLEIPLAGHFTDEEAFPAVTELLDTQEKRLITMTTGAVTASTALAMIPGDSTTPVADELADMVSVFSIALGAVLLEKFLLTKLCWLSLRIIIPVGLVLLALAFVKRGWGGFHVGVKVLLFGIVLMSVIPLGGALSNSMETAYQDKLDAALGVHDEVTAAQSEEVLSEEEALARLESSDRTLTNWKDVLHYFSSIPQKAAESFTEIPDVLNSGVTDLKENAQRWVEAFVAGLAVILVSTIAIPIGILLLGLWAVRTITGIPIPNPPLPSAHRGHRHRGPGWPDDGEPPLPPLP